MDIASTTAEVAQAAQLSPETILRMRRDPHGPFQQHRDWQFIGLGTRKVRWNKEQAIQSLWKSSGSLRRRWKSFALTVSPRR